MVRVTDASGSSDQKLITLVVEPATGSQVQSISISQSSSSNIRTAGASDSSASSTPAAPAPVELPQPDSGVSALLDSLNVAAPAPGSGSGSGSDSAAGSPAPAGTNGAYPNIKFPTGGNLNTPNPTTNLIASNQAPRSSNIRNQITADDVKTKATFERQLNAAKALANLLSIVKQAIANKNAAQE